MNEEMMSMNPRYNMFNTTRSRQYRPNRFAKTRKVRDEDKGNDETETPSIEESTATENE